MSSLLFAAALVAIGLRLAEPWQQDDGFGVIRTAGATGVEIGAKPGMAAPDFLLPLPDGSTLRLSDLRGRPVIINFWASWCIYCAAEMPAIQEIADRYGELIVVIGVNTGEPVEEIEPFVEMTGVRFALPLDRRSEVARAYAVAQMPTTVFIDRDGVIVSVVAGPVTPPMIHERLAPLVMNP